MSQYPDKIGDPADEREPPEPEGPERQGHPRRHQPLEIDGIEFREPERRDAPYPDEAFRGSTPRPPRRFREEEADVGREPAFFVDAAARTLGSTVQGPPNGLGGSESPTQFSHYHPGISLEHYALKDAVRSIPTSDGDAPVSSTPSERLLAAAIAGEYRHGRFGLMLGGISMIIGMVLGLNGVAGSTSWTAQVLGLSSQVNDAAPGVVLFIIGIFYAWITRPKVKMRDLKDR